MVTEVTLVNESGPMMSAEWSLVLLFSLCVSEAGTDPTVRPSCSPDSAVCEFSLSLGHGSTMLMKPHGDQGKAYPVRVDDRGVFSSRDLHNCSANVNLTNDELSRVVIADGFHKQVLMYNDLLPGPPIVVYKGQQVVVHLHNALVNAATSLHFHGVLQRNTPWMDGAGAISHCPINPGETFTYRFLADPVGTHWYHSHYGTQRTMGAYGPFIVLPVPVPDEVNKKPDFAKEYFLQISDWMMKDSFDIFELVRYEAISYINGYDVSDSGCFDSTKQSDGLDCGVIPFKSGLINGKGRKYTQDNQPERLVPLEVFEVEKGSRYRFRMICSSMTFSFRVSVDGHPLHLMASDGQDVQEVEVESIIIFSGERYDFWIEANDPEDVGAYWIRAETLERYQSEHVIDPHHTEAILRYGGQSGDDPTSRPTTCTAQSKCKVINCPFLYFSPHENRECIPLTELRSAIHQKTHIPRHSERFEEHFLNFHFAYDHKWQATINGIQHVPPAAPPQVYPDQSRQHLTPCDMKKCNKSSCRCTHKLDIPLGSVVQLVLVVTTTQDTSVETLNGMSHMVHLHGHHPQIIKVGYPEYNTSSGQYRARSPDLECAEGSDYCNNVHWSDKSWEHGNLPDYIRDSPPQKDTVAVPVGGYVVVRIRANNPGFWFLHCHTEFHNAEGMSMFLQVGNVSEMNAAPESMNSCGNTVVTEEEFLSRVNNPVSPGSRSKCEKDEQILWWVVFGLASLVVCLLFTNIAILCFNRVHKNHGYTPIPSDPACT